MQKWIVQGLVPILCGMALLLGAIATGRTARDSLHDRTAYCLAFADIDCQPPEGRTRTDFLNEVRSLAVQPAALHVLDDDLSHRLHRAFLAHPWVESVRRVAVARASVHVEMEYRRAILAVAQADGKWRLVDPRGILLSESLVRPRLPVLLTDVAAPQGPAGSRWSDARITAVVKTAAFLQPHLARLHLENSRIEIIEGDIIFVDTGVRVVWGHAPGQEKDGEAPAQLKLRRLLDYQTQHDGLDSLEHDVRLLAYQGHFPLLPNEPRHTVSFYGSSPPPPSTHRNQSSNVSQSCGEVCLPSNVMR